MANLNSESQTKLARGGNYDINELRRMLERTGADNYTHAICVIAMDGEISDDLIEGLTEQEHERLVATYRDGNGWDRNKAVDDALAAAMTDETDETDEGE